MSVPSGIRVNPAGVSGRWASTPYAFSRRRARHIQQGGVVAPPVFHGSDRSGSRFPVETFGTHVGLEAHAELNERVDRVKVE